MCYPLNRTDLWLWVSFDPEDIIKTVPQGFAPHVVKREIIILSESQNFWCLHLAYIPRPIPTKKHGLKVCLIPCENKTLRRSDIGRPQMSIDVVRKLSKFVHKG